MGSNYVEILVKARDEAKPDLTDLRARIEDLKKQVADIRVTVTDPQAASTLDSLLAKLDRLDGRTANANITMSGALKAEADIHAVEASLDRLNAKTKDTAGTASAAGAAIGFLRKEFSLWGGAMSALPLLGAITGLHLLIDGAVELTALLVPATIGITAWGAAAVPAIMDVYQHFKSLNTVVQATGRDLPPLTGGFSRMADAVKPQVYQLLGDALTIAGKKGGGLRDMALSTGGVLDQLAARFTVAVNSGRGFSQFTEKAASDVSGLGNTLGNLGGALGNIIRETPGTAEVLLNLAQAGSKAVEWATGAAGPVVKFGLAAHGAFVYAGLLGTGLAAMARGGLSAVASGALRAGIFVERFGAGGAAAATALGKFAGTAEKAAGLPWGWIAFAAAGLGVLIYKLATAKDATQQWLGSLQDTLSAQPAVTGLTTMMHDQTAVALRLASAHQALSAAQKQVINTGTSAAKEFGSLSGAADRARDVVSDLTSGQRQLNDENDLARYRLSRLAGAYGGSKAAMGLLIASGVTWGQLTNKQAGQWEILRQQVAATAIAYKDMGQTGGILGADMAFLTRQADGTFAAMSQLNKAADAWMSLSTGLTGAQLGVDQALIQMKTDAAAAGASFRGVNAQSLTLRNDFNTSLVPSIQQVIDGMRQAHASTRDLGSVVATDLTPAVKDGALRIQGMRDEIYTLAVEAGYQGADSIKGLTGWFDRNAGSVQNATNKVAGYAGALARLPSSVRTVFSSNITSVQQALNSYAQSLSKLNHMSATTYVRTVYDSSGSPPPGSPAGGGGGGGGAPGTGGGTPVAGNIVMGPGSSPAGTQPALAGTGYGGGWVEARLTSVSGDPLIRELAHSLRLYVREVAGSGPGSVQRALGQA